MKVIAQTAALQEALALTGSIVATGTGDELLADDTIKEAYLGGVS